MGATAGASGAGGALAGRTVMVTGASSGIGRAIATRAAARGAELAITYRGNERGARETAAEIEQLGRRAAVYQLDLARGDEIAPLVERVFRELGRVDGWVNNAGADILTGGGAGLSTVAKLETLLAVDLRGTMLASWAVAERMRAQEGGGVILNMSWDHVGFGMEGRNPQMYSAVKGGIMSFSKSLARSVAPEVRVNILAPGWIETAFGAEVMEDDRHRAVADGTPMKRWGTPDDVAGAALWLLSSDAAFITGQMVAVNGGVVM